MKKRKAMKQTSVKRKSHSLKKCKMSLKEKELMALTIFAVFIFAFLLAFVNTPQQSATVTGQAVSGFEKIDTSKAGTFLSNIINPEEADGTVIKWIIFFVFSLGLWGIFSLFFEKGKGGAIKALSIPLAFAMIYLIKPDEIFSALIGYSALGMTILVILPFLTIIFFSVKLLEKESTMRTITEIMVWYFYLAFLIYFLARALFFSTEIYNLGILIIIAIGIILSVFAIIKNKALREKIHNWNIEATQKSIQHLSRAKLTHAEEEMQFGKTARDLAYG
jgi:hypothetical protein